MKNILSFVVLCFLVLCIAGCSEKKAKDEGKKILLRWSGYAFPEYDKFRYEQSALFEKIHPNVKVKYEPITGDYTSKILTEMAGGTAPDIFFVPPIMYYDFIKKRALTDLTDFVKEDEEFFAQYYPALMEDVDFKGRKYGIEANSGFYVLYFNKDIFDAVHMPYPTNDMTLEDVVELAKKLTVRESGEKTIQYGLICSLPWTQLGILYGGTLWSADGKTCNINTEPFKKGIMFLKDIYAVHKVAPLPQEAKEVGSREQFIAGRSAMYMGHTWEIAAFRIQNRSRKKFNWSMVMLPVPNDGKRAYICGGNILCVSAKTKNPRLAYELAKFMCEPERIKFLIEVGDSVPIRSAGLEMDTLMNSPVHPKEVAINIHKAMDYVIPESVLFNDLLNAAQFYETVSKELEKYFLLKQDINETLNSLERKISNLFL
ncbi:MAG: sugar ABC transporter substrate-binding protein [Planctomycetes bacterium]|nr:sugar ABC transporter substrate-binding protein [Planctomycetota bacterium]